jgi:hypothetical protein
VCRGERVVSFRELLDQPGAAFEQVRQLICRQLPR